MHRFAVGRILRGLRRLGSVDGSTGLARRLGSEVVELDASSPFTAARARNAGIKRLKEKAPGLQFVQLIDGDCELDKAWPRSAMSFLNAHPEVAIAFGRLKEANPQASIYNWLCDREWNGPVGEVSWSGGIVMARLNALEAAGGYREDLIAGEEPELCVRARGEMAYLAPCKRNGVSRRRHVAVWSMVETICSSRVYLRPMGPPTRRVSALFSLAMASCVAVGSGAAGCLFNVWTFAWTLGLGWGMIYPLEVARQMVRNDGSLRDRATLAFFQTLARFPETWGQVKFAIDRLIQRRPQLIEYK